MQALRLVFFAVGENTKCVVIGTCEVKVPRGGDNTKSFTTTNLIHYLMAKHPEIDPHEIFRKESKQRTKTAKEDKETITRVPAFFN